MAEVGSDYVSILPSAKGFGAKLGSQIGPGLDRAGKSSGKRFGDVFARSYAGPLKAIGALAVGVFAAGKVAGFLKDSIAEARESQKVGALTVQVIKSTGKAAKVSAAQVGNLATAISNKTGIDDEAIQSGANLLLTFKNIKNEAGKGNDIFSQTTQIMTDVSAAMGQEPKAAAIQLGKALNDPIKGVAQLNRIGVTFSDKQKKVIKRLQETGDVAGAQKVILKELKSEFGGAAAASSTAGEKFKVAFGNLKEQIGTVALPLIDKVAGLLTTKVVPAISTFITQLQTGEGLGGRVRTVFDAIMGALKSVATWGKTDLFPALRDAYQTILPGARQALDILTGGFGGAQGASKTFGDVVKTIGSIITDVVIPAVAMFVRVYLPLWATQARAVIEAIKGIWQAGKQLIIILTPVFVGLSRMVLNVFGTIINGAADAFGWVPGIGPKLKSAAAKFNTFKTAADRALGDIEAAAQSLADGSGKYGTAWAEGLARGISRSSHVPIAAARGVANKIAAATRAEMRTGSPSKVAATIGGFFSDGLAVGISAKTPGAVKAAKAMAQQVADAVAEKLKAAQAKLKDLISTRDQFASGVSDSMKSFGSITATESGDNSPLTSTSIVAQMSSRLSALRDFAASLAKLRKRGLNDTTYAQLVQAGVDQGGALASALLGGGKSSIGDVNSLTKQINSAASSLGVTSSRALYQAGVDAAQGLVAGLTSQQRSVDAAVKGLVPVKGVKVSGKASTPAAAASTVRLSKADLDYLADRISNGTAGALVGAGSRVQNSARNGVKR